MNRQQLGRALDELEAVRVPSDLDLWPAIGARLRAPARPSRGRWLPPTRLGWAVAGLLLFLALGTAVYAVAPIISRAFRMEPGLQHIDEARLGQEINLSQTVDGFTVTLERAYADANRIVLGYTVTGPEGRRFNNYEATHVALTDQDGTVFPQCGGVGAGIVNGTGGYVTSFDSGVLKQAPAVLHLRLVMHVSGLPSDAFAASEPSPTRSATVEDETPQSTVVELAPLPVGSEVGAGPFTFDLSVPFIRGRVMSEPQTVEAAGIAITLERVVVTPSETRALLRFEPPVTGEADAGRRWIPIFALQSFPGGAREESGGAYVCSVLAPLYDQRGEWTLVVSELVGFDETGSQKDIRVAGPWLFRFRVP